jgi:deoxyadenosine/deoxycytidine kinase
MKPKLILLNGFAGVGKTTIARRYKDNHPLSLSIEIDELIVMLGQWLTYEEKAREYVFELTKSMIAAHLRAEKNVLLPYLLTNASHAEAFEEIATTQNAQFYEVFLSVDKEDAVERLMARGTWGEAGTPPITKYDLPVINTLFDTMMEATSKRTRTIYIHPLKNDIETTYKEFLEKVGEGD